MATRSDPIWWLYLVRRRDRALYTGIALDVERRVSAHAAGKGAKALRGQNPLVVVFTAPIGNRAKAQRVEAQLKRLAKADKERLVASRAFARRWLARVRRAAS
jgi:putative endonuclease